MKEKHIFWLLAVFIVFMHFDGFLKLFFGYHPLVRGFKYVFAFFFGIISLNYIKKSKAPLVYPTLLFSLFVLIQFANPLMWQGKGIFLSVLGLFYHIGYLPLFFIGYNILDKNKLDSLMQLIVGLSSLSAVVAHVQLMVGYPQYLSYMYLQPTEFVLEHASVYGPIAFDLVPPVGWYMAGLIFCLNFYFRGKRRLLFSVLGLNLFAAILMSGLRMGILLSLFALTVFFTFRIKQVLKLRHVKKIGLALIFGILILILLLNNVLDERQIGRYMVLRNPLAAYIKTRGFTWTYWMPKIISTYPFGGGLRHAGIIPSEDFGVENLKVYTGDNYFNVVLGELGIQGFTALLILYYFIVKTSINNYFHVTDKAARLTIASFSPIIFAFMITSIYGNPNGWMFWLFLGVIVKSPDYAFGGDDEVNKVFEGVFFVGFVRGVFGGSVFARILRTQKDRVFFDVLGDSKAVLFLRRVMDVLEGSRLLGIAKKIID